MSTQRKHTFSLTVSRAFLRLHCGRNPPLRLLFRRHFCPKTRTCALGPLRAETRFEKGREDTGWRDDEKEEETATHFIEVAWKARIKGHKKGTRGEGRILWRTIERHATEEAKSSSPSLCVCAPPFFPYLQLVANPIRLLLQHRHRRPNPAHDEV